MRSTSLAAPLLLELQRAILERDGWPHLRVELPGHSPGQVALWREWDRVALTTDVFYSIDNLSRDAPAHVPIHAYNYDTAQAIESIRKLAALEPDMCLPGHGSPIRGDVSAQLERAAEMG